MSNLSKYHSFGFEILDSYISDGYSRFSYLVNANFVLIEIIGSPQSSGYFESNIKFENYLGQRDNSKKLYLAHDFSRLNNEGKIIRRHYVKWLIQNREHFDTVVAFGLSPTLKSTVKAIRYFTIPYLKIKVFNHFDECREDYKQLYGDPSFEAKKPKSRFDELWEAKKEMKVINGKSYKIVRRDEWKGRIRNFAHDTFVVDGNIVVREQKGDYYADMLPELIDVLKRILDEVGAANSKFYYILDMKSLRTNLEGRKKSTQYFREEIENTELLIFANLNPIIRIAVNFGRQLFPDKMDYALIEKDIDSSLRRAIEHKYADRKNSNTESDDGKMSYEELENELARVKAERDKNVQNAIVSLVNSTWDEEAEVEMFDDETNPFSDLHATVKMVRLDLAEMYENEIKLRKKAEESDRLKSSFLANISHELRTPMNAIMGFTDLLSMNSDESSSDYEYLNLIKESSNHLLKLINDLINLSKIDSGNFEIKYSYQNIEELVTDVCNNFTREVREKQGRVQLFTSGDPSLSGYLVKTDDLRLKQVLINLIGNALKFTQEGFVKIDYKLVENQLVFVVSDSGIGISSEAQQKIFDRFMQADSTLSRQFGGTGLGLAITKNIVELMNGQIWVESSLGSGSSFTFNLPVELARENIILKPEVNTRKIEVSGLKILIADDLDVSSKVIEIMLGKKNDYTHVLTGLQAVEALKVGDFDLVFMDIQMPELNGYEAVAKIREFNVEIKIIAQTANAFANDREKILSSGFDGYVSKPIIKENLLNETSRVLHGRMKTEK